MIAWLVTAATLHALPCERAEDVRRELLELARSGDPAAFEARVAGLGPFAVLPSEARLEATERADLAGRRFVQACALAARDAPRRLETSDRARLGAILDRPEFSTARRRDSDLIERLFARLQAWFLSLLGTSEAQSFSEASRMAVLALALAAAVGATLRLLTSRGRRLSPRRAEAHAARLPLEDPAVHLAAAMAALDSEPREAIRQGLLCLLSALERARLARPDRVKTNRELAAELPERGAPVELCGEVERLFDWYDRAYYSLEPVPGAGARAFVEGASRLRTRLAEAAP